MTDVFEIAQELLVQDNASTKHPIYVVQQLHRIYGLDATHAKKFIWTDDEGNEYEDNVDFLPSNSGIVFDRVGIDDVYEHVQSFFTRAGAELYLRENKHNLREPIIWVDSGHRNAEWIAVREYLMSSKFSELEPYDKRLLADLTKMWSEACEIARQYCPVDVGRNHIKEGIPRLAKRAADAEAERDEFRARLNHYEGSGGSQIYTYIRPREHEELVKGLQQKIDTRIVEELSIASIVKANKELKERVEVLEMAVEYLNGEKK